MLETALVFFVVLAFFSGRIDITQNIYLNQKNQPSEPIITTPQPLPETTTEFDFNATTPPREESIRERNIRLGLDIDGNIYTSKKTLLFWTPLDFNPGMNFSDFETDQVCPVATNCEVTFDRSMISYSDVVVFHVPSFNGTYDPPPFHHGKQKWIFLNEEPPTATENMYDFNNTFNITMTYRRDSDIYDPYGYLVEKTPMEKYMYLRNGTRNYAKGKSKMAAWFASSCDVQSKRQDYVKELQKYASVDIYGDCGTLKCEKGSTECYDMLQNDYKFYLSFESGICKDYISEKLWHVMQYDVVPVVLGGAAYAEMLPPNSYIDISKFPSPMALGKYLLQLDYNDAMYNQYFAWKRTHKVIQKNWMQRFCNLCRYIHENDGQYSLHMNMVQWWDQCTEPKEYYRNSASVLKFQ